MEPIITTFNRLAQDTWNAARPNRISRKRPKVVVCLKEFCSKANRIRTPVEKIDLGECTKRTNRKTTFPDLRQLQMVPYLRIRPKSAEFAGSAHPPDADRTRHLSYFFKQSQPPIFRMTAFSHPALVKKKSGIDMGITVYYTSSHTDPL